VGLVAQWLQSCTCNWRLWGASQPPHIYLPALSLLPSVGSNNIILVTNNYDTLFCFYKSLTAPRKIQSVLYVTFKTLYSIWCQVRRSLLVIQKLQNSINNMIRVCHGSTATENNKLLQQHITYKILQSIYKLNICIRLSICHQTVTVLV